MVSCIWRVDNVMCFLSVKSFTVLLTRGWFTQETSKDGWTSDLRRHRTEPPGHLMRELQQTFWHEPWTACLAQHSRNVRPLCAHMRFSRRPSRSNKELQLIVAFGISSGLSSPRLQ